MGNPLKYLATSCIRKSRFQKNKDMKLDPGRTHLCLSGGTNTAPHSCDVPLKVEDKAMKAPNRNGAQDSRMELKIHRKLLVVLLEWPYC